MKLIKSIKEWASDARYYRGQVRAWREASTVGQLGERGAAWCRGEMGVHPSGYDVPAFETEPMLPTLERANAAGFFTYQSQQGGMFAEDEEIVEAKAYVQGFLERDRLEEFRRHLEGAGMLVIDSMIHDEPLVRYSKSGEVGGTWRPRAENHLRNISAPAYNALRDAADLFVLDTVWNRNDALWAALDRWAASQA